MSGAGLHLVDVSSQLALLVVAGSGRRGADRLPELVVAAAHVVRLHSRRQVVVTEQVALDLLQVHQS